MTKIIEDFSGADFREAVEAFRGARKIAALTGAGVSTESGIPDFRSPGGLWEKFDINEYGTIEVFYNDPPKAWKLYRAIGEALVDRTPNPSHDALAELEKSGRLEFLVTQNIDGLHQAAGSENVLEIHGSWKNLQCLFCESVRPITGEQVTGTEVPACPGCGEALKPDVVFFGESVRHMDEIMNSLRDVDVIIVAGTSAQVAPASMLPALVSEAGGKIFEFNIEETALTSGGAAFFSVFGIPSFARSDYLFKGRAGTTLPAFARAVLEE